MAHKIEVNWTGKYPALCFGQWIISIDDKNFPIPSEIVKENMGTYKEYSSWHFEDWQEVFEYYPDGEEFESWVRKNITWIKTGVDKLGITDFTYEDLKNLYNKINENDWRSNSCGGCI